MKQKIFLLAAIIQLSICSNAQFPAYKHKIAIFTSLFLDSAFDNMGEYRYTKNEFPKFLNPGLEFYEGVKLALDSLDMENAPLEVYVYDTRSAKETILQQLNRPEMDSMELIIANCSNAEIKIFADAGLKRKIPVINTNLPNDGGVTNNPFFVLLNPTLKTQCEGVYKYLQKNNASDKIVVFRKKGVLEDRIKYYLDDFGKTTSSIPLKYKYIELSDSFTLKNVQDHLDSTAKTICFAASLDDNFSKRLITQLATLNSHYPVSAIGMPTWDNIKDLQKPKYNGLEISYARPFNNTKTDKVSQGILNYFTAYMFARPSDMVFRGFEITWNYAQLLLQYGKDITSNLTAPQSNVISYFDIQPVLNKQTRTVDYFENKKLYFLKWQDGVIKGVY